MIALVLTCRPQWQPWLLHQLAKQETEHSVVLFDDCSKPLEWKPAVTVRPNNRLQLSMGAKRQMLLDVIKTEREPFAWFDDDDWHPKERLAIGQALIDDGATAAGYAEGTFCDVKTLQTRKLACGEAVTFNGAVFAPQCATYTFDAINRGEDTNWLRKVLAGATVVSSPIMEHCWMSHDGNICGRRGSMTFEGRRFDRFDSWELDFLRKL